MAALKEELVVALSKAVIALEAEGLPHALVGGVAVGARTEPRVTRDVDFVIPVVDDADAELKVLALQRSGFLVESVFERDEGRISTVRTRQPAAREVFVDFLLSNPRIEAEIVADASREAVVSTVTCRVAQPWHLIAMKVLANRRKDQSDLGELISRANRSTLAKAEHALRLMSARGAGPKRDLVAELDRHVRSVAGETGERKSRDARARRIVARNRAR
ncbi:MAG: hypothetical protein QM723_29040 [Myxococcaceae bacterium]